MYFDKIKRLFLLPIFLIGLLGIILLATKGKVHTINDEPQYDWNQKVTNGSGWNWGEDFIHDAKFVDVTNDSIATQIYTNRPHVTHIFWNVRYYDKETLSKPGDADFDNRRYDCQYEQTSDFVGGGVGNQKWTFDEDNPCWKKSGFEKKRWINVQVNSRAMNIWSLKKNDPTFSFLAPYDSDEDLGDRITQTSYTRQNLNEVKLIAQINLNGLFPDAMKITFEDSTNGIKEVVTPIDNGDGTAIAETTLTNVSTNKSYDFLVSSNTGQTGNQIIFNLPRETITQTSYIKQDTNEVKLIAQINLNGNNVNWFDITFEDKKNGIKKVVTPIDNGDGTAIAETTLTNLENYIHYNFDVVSSTGNVGNTIVFVLANEEDPILSLSGDQGILSESRDGVIIGFNCNYFESLEYVELVTDTNSIYWTWIFDSTSNNILFNITNLKPGITYSNWKLLVYSTVLEGIVEVQVIRSFSLS